MFVTIVGIALTVLACFWGVVAGHLISALSVGEERRRECFLALTAMFVALIFGLVLLLGVGR